MNDTIDEQTKKVIVSSAKELVKKLLRKGNPRFNKSNVFSLAVSKFIVVKEALIKKNITTRTVYYNNLNDYQNKTILKIYDYILKYGKYRRDDLKISLEDPDKMMEEAIWVINKIKDSFAHKKYKFDLVKNKVIINNVTSEFELICAIPIKLLQEFSVDIFDIGICETINAKVLSKSKLYTKRQGNNSINIDKIISHDIENPKKINNYEINTKIMEEYTKYLELENIVRSIEMKDNNLTLDELKQLMKYMHFFQNNDSKYLIQARQMIDDMMRALNIKADSKSVTLFASLYNYATLMLLDDTKKIDYSHMKTKGIYFEYTIENQATVADVNIKKRTSSFIEHCKKLVDLNKEHNVNVTSILSKELANYYSDILTMLGNRNEQITTSIRNAYSHSNVKPRSNGTILHVDKADQTNSKVKFVCIAKSIDLFNFIEQFDKQTEFNMNDFLDELRYILTPETFVELKLLINDISLIVFNQEIHNDKNLEYMYIQKIHDIIQKSS